MRATMQGSTFYKAEASMPKSAGKIVLGLLFLIFSTVLFFTTELYAGHGESVKIFSLLEPDAPLKEETAPPELQDPWVYGISWRFRWKTLEPKEGHYRWDLLDKAVSLTHNAGKKVILRVVSGIHTPDWVYQAGAVPFEFNNTDLYHSKNYRTHLRMPVPWDEVYLGKWEKFIRAFGARYHEHPDIYSIAMAGGGHIGEMNLPKAVKKWHAIGYSDDKLIGAWRRIIRFYQEAFPNVPTNLAINEPLGKKKSHVMEPMVAYVLSTYPGRVYLQQNGLKADLPRDHRIRKIIRNASAKTNVGYQMVGGKGYLDESVGDRKVAFQNAIEDHASYIEVYASDLRDPAYRPALQFLAKQTTPIPTLPPAGGEKEEGESEEGKKK